MMKRVKYEKALMDIKNDIKKIRLELNGIVRETKKCESLLIRARFYHGFSSIESKQLDEKINELVKKQLKCSQKLDRAYEQYDSLIKKSIWYEFDYYPEDDFLIVNTINEIGFIHGTKIC